MDLYKSNMSITTEFQKIVDSIEGVAHPKELLLRIAISLVIVVVVAIFASQISKILLKLTGYIVWRKNEERRDLMLNSLKKPLSLMLIILSVAIGFCICTPSGELAKVTMFIIRAGAIISICWAGVRYLNNQLSFYSISTDSDSKSRQTAFRFIANVSKIIIICIGALLILELFGYSATRIFAALGIGGVAIAFACKDAVENLISGFIIVFNKPFHVGDFIEVGEISGTVEDIAVRSTTILTVDGSRCVMPNTELTNQNIVNWSKMEKRLVKETFNFSYKNSAEAISDFQNRLQQMLIDDENVINDGIRICFMQYEKSGMQIELHYYLYATAWNSYCEERGKINLKIKELIDSTSLQYAFNANVIYTEK